VDSNAVFIPIAASIYKVDTRILAMVFNRCLVVSLRCFYLVFEPANIYALAINSYSDFPPFVLLIPSQTFEFGVTFSLAFAGVPDVLRCRYRS